MNYSKEQIEKAVDSMTPAKRNYMFSVEIFDKLNAIYQKYGITREMLIQINDSISYFMMKLEPEETINNKIKEIVPESTKAIALYQELNSQIVQPFKQIKEEVSVNNDKPEATAEDIEVIEDQNTENELLLDAPEKEDILAGIENPYNTPRIESTINVNTALNNKLTSITTNKPQTEKINLTQPETQRQQQKSYAKDPYREPIE